MQPGNVEGKPSSIKDETTSATLKFFTRIGVAAMALVASPLLSTAVNEDPIDGRQVNKLLTDRFKGFVDGGSLPEGSADIDEYVSKLESSNPTASPGLSKNYEPLAKGLWQVAYAPHIRILERVLRTKFQVSYCLDGQGYLKSNVKFTNAFVSGWLNAQGTYTSRGDAETSIKWDRVWADVSTSNIASPSAEGETGKHFFPSLVSVLGQKGFIEPISRFPVSYLDDSVCIFKFPASGTKIVACKVNTRDLSQVVNFP